MTIQELNQLPSTEKAACLQQCCGAATWVNKMLSHFPVTDKTSLLALAEKEWWQCTEADWLQAFTHHPRIGSRETLAKKFASTVHFTSEEQKSTSKAGEAILDALLQGNQEYEKRFGYIFIVCATGKSAEEMLSLLQLRLHNAPGKEIRIAAEEQNKITLLRIEKLLA